MENLLLQVSDWHGFLQPIFHPASAGHEGMAHDADIQFGCNILGDFDAGMAGKFDIRS